MSKSILIACEESQIVTKAFRELGFEAFSCDLKPCTGGHPEWHLQDDAVATATKFKWDMMIAHPPCDRLANSGVRWLHEPPKGEDLDDIWEEFFKGVEFYKSLRNVNIKYKAIENPVMHKYAIKRLGAIKRKIIQPWWCGDPYFKATGFELHNLPPLVATNKLIPPKKGTKEYKEWSYIHYLSPNGKDGISRKTLRSRTFPGVAMAMALQWGNVLQPGIWDNFNWDKK